MLREFALAAGLALTAAAPAALADGAAETAAAIGPDVGAPAPELAATMQDGSIASMAKVSGEAGVALVFFRSADWCPFCRKQLQDLTAVEDRLAELGWTLAGVSYDSPETLNDFAEASGVGYPLLSDNSVQTVIAYGLLNETYAPGSRAYGIPHPAIVFVDADGEVAAVLREEGYRTRPAVEIVIETAEQLSAAG